MEAVDVKSWLESNEDLTQIPHNWNRIPLLNVCNIQEFKASSLVRFRGMVQDMFNPEYYLDAYEVTNKETREVHLKRGKYQDSASCTENEYINFESNHNVTKDRQTFVIITPPGLNEWIIKLEQQIYKPNNQETTSLESSNAMKRCIDDIETDPEINTMEFDSGEISTKKHCLNHNQQTSTNTNGTTLSHESLLNMPLEGRHGKACHVKVYDNENSIKLNEMIDVIGFLSLDAPQELTNEDNDDMDDNAMELQAHNPPTSLIPKIHCVAFKNIVDINPIYEETRMPEAEMQATKKELEIILTQLLLGDKLAAEYLIYHLISKVYTRVELMSLGKFTLNISNVPTPVLQEYGKNVYEFLEQIIPKSHYLAMSLENMNEKTFIPKKDYKCDRITSGILQLSDNTHLVLDETKLSAGKLNEAGVHAIGAISNIIKNQRSYYDFVYYKMDFDCDIPILVLSEGKSLLPSDYHVPLMPEDAHITTFEEVVEAVKVYLTPELLISIRKYLTNARHADYQISEYINELVQNEFIKMRAEHNSTAQDLHSLLVLARSVCLSEGKMVLDEMCWKRACELEHERKQRIQK